MFDNTTKLVLLFVILVISGVGVSLVYYRYTKPVVIETEIEELEEPKEEKEEVSPPITPPVEPRVEPKNDEDEDLIPLEPRKRKRLRDRRK